MTSKAGGIALLKNVSTLMTMIETIKGRNAGLDAIGVFSGYPGYGKTIAACFAQNKHRALYLEVGSTWTKKDFLKKLLTELGEPQQKGTLTELLDRAIRVMAGDPDQVLLIDEADRLLDRKLTEIVRDLHDRLHIPVILIGEERLPMKLGAPDYERLHSRVLRWELAQPCDLDDARALADHLIPETSVTDELLTDIVSRTNGVARRIATTLYAVEGEAAKSGADVMDLSTYRGPIHTGQHVTRHRKRGAAA